MNISIATVSDIPELCELLASLFSQEAEFDVDHNAQTNSLTKIITDPTIGEIIVAKQSGAIVGMVNLLYTVSTALGGRVALLEDMVVNHQHRGAGIGSKLIEYAIAHATNQNIQRISLLTDHDNEKAQHFYQQHGFDRSSMVTFRQQLNKD